MKNGFTLAEVLITLGIIGVVAALTMPSLIQNHRKHVVETRLAKFASTYRQAIKMAEAENGPVGNWTVHRSNGTDYYEHYKTYLDKYIKTTSHKILGDSVLFVLADGSGFFYYYDIGFCVDYKACLDAYQKSWIQGGRYVNGTNTFLFQYDGRSYTNNNPTLEAMMEGCKDEYGYYCTKLIERNGWKIPKDYPLKF